jgi:glyoxylase-like metal-dependent hydrolase (beta-lactamase superfamily II)
MSTDVAPGVHRLGNDFVGYYLVEDSDRLVLVDAGMPKLRRDLDALLRSRGRTLGDLTAVVLTHGHSDHVGFAEQARQAGVPVHAPDGDAEMARTGKMHPTERSLLPYLRNASPWKMLARFPSMGRPKTVQEVVPYGDGAELPGGLRAIATPGHSPGHHALLLTGRGVLFAGDALCTLNVLTGRRGPQIPAGGFNHSSETAMGSLRRLEDLDAGTVLFGHGEPWTEGIAAAVARAREAGPS